MPPPRRSGTRARLKRVAVGNETLLLVRFVPFTDQVRNHLGTRIRELVPHGRLTFDGEMYSVRGEPAIKAVWELVRGSCEPVYDPNLSVGLPGLPNPWSIPTEPPRDREHRSIIYMAMVRHPELGEALAFQSPVYDDDFVLDFRKELSDARKWRLFRKDLDSIPVWVIAEYYASRAHDVLDRYFECWWDEFLAGEEWDILPPPADSQYPLRTLGDRDFAELGVSAGGGIEEINGAYREKKEAYLANRLHVEQWLDVDAAYQRIRRHHFPTEPERPEVVVAPIHMLLLLRQRFPDSEADRVDWYYGFSHALEGVPAMIAETPEGEERVAAFLLGTKTAVKAAIT